MFKIDEKEFLELLDNQLQIIAEDIFTESQDNIIKQNIIDRGTLLKTGKINSTFLKKSIVYPTPYADEIEFGRPAGSFPPLEPLKNWIRRKGLVKGERAIQRFAFNIAKDIERNGKDPRPFLQPALDKVRHEL